MKDKLEPNMYVRIKWGNGLQTISQCKNIVNMGDTQYAKEDFYIHTDHSGEVIYKTMIIKSSFNIIDLVECGDYVNGSKVVNINYDLNYDEDIVESITIFDYSIEGNDILHNEEIKSIVTHEQMEQMAYKVGE